MTGKTTWLTPYLAVWADGAGTVVQALPAARAAKTFSALEKAFGAEAVLARWQAAWATTPEAERKFLTPETFARRYGDFAPVEYDAFGFVVVNANQRTAASKIVASLNGDGLAQLGLYKAADLPSTFPLGVMYLAVYERWLRAAHDESAAKYPALVSRRRADPTVAASYEKFTSALTGIA